MARRKKLTLADLGRSSGADWAARYRQEYQSANDPRNREAEADAIVQQLRAEDPSLTDEQLADVFGKVVAGEEWTISAAQQPDFSNVTGTATTVPVMPESRGLVGETINRLGLTTDLFQGSLWNLVAGATEQTQRMSGARDIEEGGLVDMLLRSSGMSMMAPSTTRVMRDQAQENMDSRTALDESLARGNAVTQWVGAGVADAASSGASGAVSLIGGPAGALAIGDAYAQAYYQGLEEGNLSGAELEAWALSQAAPESISMIPAGKLLERVPVLGPMLKRRAAEATEQFARKVMSRTGRGGATLAKTLAGEATEQGITQLTQDAAAVALANQNHMQALADFAEGQAPATFGEALANAGRAARAGAILGAAGGTVAGVNEARSFQADIDTQADATTRRALDQSEAVLGPHTERANQATAAQAVADEQQAAADAQAAFTRAPRTTTSQEVADVQAGRAVEPFENWAQRSADSMPVRQEDIPSDAEDFNRMRTRPGRKNDQMTQTERESLGEAVSTATGSVIPDQSSLTRAAEREAAAMQAQEGRVQDARAADNRAIDREKKAEQDAAKKAERDTAAATKLHAQRREKAADTARELNKGLPRTQRMSAIADTLAEWDSNNAVPTADGAAAYLQQYGSQKKDNKAPKTPQTVEEKAQAAINRINAATQSKQTRAENKAISAIAKANPEATPDQIAELYRQQQATPTKNDNKLTDTDTDAEARRLAREAGIDTPELQENSPDGWGQVDADNVRPFVPTVKAAIKGLAQKNTKETADIQNLLRQGKLVFVPNPKSIGRNSVAGQALYSPRDNKMYIYTDRLDPNDVTGTMIRAFHEATHAGDFNAREGRGAVMSSLLNDVKGSADKVRAEARRGNKLAQRAVAAAENDTRMRNSDGREAARDIEDKEVLAYLVGEATKERNAPLGGVRNVLNDMRSGARNILRDQLGANLDVTFDDLRAATKGVAGELVNTDMQSALAGVEQEMIVGPSAANWADQSRRYNGRVDGKERGEISDEAGSITTDTETLDALVRGEDVPLGELMSHPALFAAYPDFVNTSVRVDKKMNPKVSSGSWDGRRVNVVGHIADAARLGDPTQLKDLVLHEMQHAIQEREGFVSGANSRSFIPADVQNNYDMSGERLDGFIKNFELGLAENSLSPEARTRWDRDLERVASRYGNNKDNIPRRDRALAFLNGKYANDSNNRLIQSAGRRWEQVKENLKTDRDQYLDAERAALLTYLRDYGEAEARNTELRQNMTDAELDAEYAAGRNAESTIATDSSSVSRGVTADSLRDTAPNAASRTALSNSEPVDLEMSDTREVPKENLTTKEVLKRLTDESVRTQTSDVQIAEKLDGLYRKAIKKDLGSKDGTPAQHAEIEKALTAVENADPAKAAELWNEFARSYPELSRVLSAMRARIDDNSKELVRLMMNSGVALSPAEVRTVKTVLANRGSYLTRAYSAFQKQPGRQWAEKRWSDYKNKLDDYLNNGQRLPDKVRENIEAVRDAVTFIEGKLIIPPADVLSDMPMADLTNLFRDNGGSARMIDPDWDTDTKRDFLVNELARFRAAQTPESRTVMAEETIKSLLGLTPKTSHFARMLTSTARDPGTLKHKDFVPEELRRVLGELRNPAARVLTTLSTQAQLLARQRMFNDLLRNHEGTLVVKAEDINKPGVRDALSAKSGITRQTLGPQQLEGEQFGPLNGYYVHPNVYSTLVETPAMFESWTEALNKGFSDMSVYKKAFQATGKGLGRLNRFEKISGVILSPFNWAGNFLGSPMNLIRSGNFNLPTYWSGLKTGAFDYTFSTWTGGTTELFNDAVRYLNIEAADVAEMQNILGDKIKDYMDGKIGSDSILDSGRQQAHKVGRTVLAGYAAMDNWTKIANYHQRVELLKKYYAEADPKKPLSEIKAEAGHTTSYTNISNERVPKFLRTLESNGLTKFVPYFSEVFRTTFTNYNQGLLDLQRAAETSNPKAAAIMRNAGMQRILGNTIATIGLPAVTTAPLKWAAMGVALAVGEDDDAEEKRRLVGEFNREQDIIQVGRDKDGNPIFLPISQRLDPNGPVTDLLRIAINTPDNGELAGSVGSYLRDLLINPQFMKTAIAAATEDTVAPSLMNQMMPETMDSARTFADDMLGTEPASVNKMSKLIDGWLPGFIKSQANHSKPGTLHDIVDGKLEATDGSRQFRHDLANVLGGRYETLNVQRALNTYGRESSDTKTGNRRRFNQAVTMATNLTDEQLDSFVMSLAEREISRMSEDYKNVKSMRAWGFTDEAIAAGLKNAGWSKAEIPMLLAGMGVPTVSMKSLKDHAEQRLLSMDGKEKEQFTAATNRALSAISKRKAELAKMGIIVEEK